MEPQGDWLSGLEACVVSTLDDLCVISLGTKTTARWRRKIAYAKCCCIAVIGCTLYTHSHTYSLSRAHNVHNVHHGHKCCLVSREMHEFILLLIIIFFGGVDAVTTHGLLYISYVALLLFCFRWWSHKHTVFIQTVQGTMFVWKITKWRLTFFAWKEDLTCIIRTVCLTGTESIIKCYTAH